MKSKNNKIAQILVLLVFWGGILISCNKSSDFEIGSTGLPVIFINTPEESDINDKDKWMKGIDISIYSSEGELLYHSKDSQIKGRGNSTWRGENKAWRKYKNPYTLKLSSKESILGMPKNKRWILLANYFDRTLLRNDVAFHIASLTNMKWTPRGRFVELVLNGRHQGNYYLCEQIRVDKKRVAIEKMKPEDTSGIELTGGYLMELDISYDRKNKFKSTLGLPYMFKSPEEELQKEQLDYFRNYIDTLETILTTDSLLLAHKYNDYINVESFVDWWLVNELMQSIEAQYPKSVYMYKDRGGKLTMGPIWDYDMATFRPKDVNHFECTGNIYFPYLFKDRYFINNVKERWKVLHDSFLTVPDYISSMAKTLKESNRIDKELWPGPYDYKFHGLIKQEIKSNADDNLNYDEAIELMIKTLIQRVEWMDKEINKL